MKKTSFGKDVVINVHGKKRIRYINKYDKRTRVLKKSCTVTEPIQP